MTPAQFLPFRPRRVNPLALAPDAPDAELPIAASRVPELAAAAPSPVALETVRHAAAPPDTVEAEAAPLRFERQAPVNVRQPVIDEGLASADPRILRTALEAKYDHSGEERGLLGNIGHHLRHGGKAALLGLMSGGLPGALLGGVAGLISPKVADTMEINQIQMPRRMAENAAGEEIQFRRRQADRQDEAEQLRQLNFERQQRATEAQIANQATDNAFQNERLNFEREKERRLQEEQARDNQRSIDQQIFERRQKLASAGGEPVQLADLFTPTARTPNRGNVIPVKEGEAYRLPTPQQQDARKLAQTKAAARARSEAEIEKRLTLLPLELKTFADKERIKQSYADTRDKLDLAGVPTLSQFESAKAEAKELATRASKAREDKDEKAQAAANKLQAQAEAAYAKASAYHSAMLDSGGYEDNSAGGWVGLRRKTRTNKGGVSQSSAASGRSTAAAKDISQEVFDYTVKTKFNGDVNAAKAEAKKRGYTISGQPIQ